MSIKLVTSSKAKPEGMLLLQREWTLGKKLPKYLTIKLSSKVCFYYKENGHWVRNCLSI